MNLTIRSGLPGASVRGDRKPREVLEALDSAAVPGGPSIDVVHRRGHRAARSRVVLCASTARVSAAVEVLRAQRRRERRRRARDRRRRAGSGSLATSSDCTTTGVWPSSGSTS